MIVLTKDWFPAFQSEEEIGKLLLNCVTNPTSDSTPVLNYYQQRVLNNPTPDLPEPINQALEKTLKTHKNAIINTLIKKKLIDDGHNFVESYDWKLKWILGSSKMASLKEPVVQVDLNCLSLDGNLELGRKIVSFECGGENLEELIGVLRQAKETLRKE